MVLLPLAGQHWAGGAGYGPALAVLGFGALGAPLLWWLGRTTASRTRLGLVLFGLTIALLPLTTAVGWALVPLAVAGAATVHVEGALTETIQDGVPDTVRAGLLGLTDSVMVGAAMVGSLVAPWLSGAIGPRALLVALAVLTLAGAGAVHASRPARATSRGSALEPHIPAQRTAADARTR
jgi:hypothetical protein